MTQPSVTQPPCFLPAANPRINSCQRCGKLACKPKPDQPVKESLTPEPLLSPDANQGSRVAVRLHGENVAERTHSDENAGNVPDPTRPRDVPLERELTLLAARAAGHSSDRGLRAFADARAWPGGVRADLDCTREIAEELADASSYAVWGIERIYDQVLAGDPSVLDEYERLMRAHAKIIEAWAELLTEAA